MGVFAKFTDQRPVDVTVFLGQWPHRQALSTDVSDLTAMADQHRVDRLCVSHIASIFGHDTLSGNEALLAESAVDERLAPFVILNPTEPTWPRELTWAAERGAKGIRLVPGYHGYSLTTLKQSGLISAAKEYQLPIQIMIRLQDERLEHPRYRTEAPPIHTVAELIVAAEGHPLLFSGLRLGDWESVWRHLPTGQSLAHVYGDLWFCNGPLAAMQFLCEKGWAKRFAYGSCLPIQTAEATMLQLAAANISEQERYDLCRGNGLRFLGVTDH